MTRKVVIIGGGISGIVTAYVLNKLDPTIQLTLLDAGPGKNLHTKTIHDNHHYGATLGSARDSRHFTGTEGLSFQNPIHTKLLFERAGKDSEGWQTIPDRDLTEREIRWRQECVDRYKRDVTADHNPYDDMYATLNYSGMAAWDWLAEVHPPLASYRMTDAHVYVAFADEALLRADQAIETNLNPRQESDPVRTVAFTAIHDQPEDNIATGHLASELLRVSGQTWRIQSVWWHLFQELSAQKGVSFQWDTEVVKYTSLPLADTYVWAAGSSYATPDIYREHGRVQGIGGWWVTVKNNGFKAPFKLSAPQPSGYINFTPDGDQMHVSGGFGWVGERVFAEAEKLLLPSKEHFVADVGAFLKMSRSEVSASGVSCCIRPTTPTGLPDVQCIYYDSKPHIMISGAGKAGSTQSPLLALYVAGQLGLKTASSDEIVKKGLDLLKTGL